MNLTFLKKYSIYLLALGAILFVIISFLILQPGGNKTTKPQPSPEPSASTTPPLDDPPLPAQGREYQDSLQVIQKSEEEEISRDSLVGELLNLIPYKGSNFTLDYSFTNNHFILILDKGSESEGNQEFDQFLKNNNVLDRNWIRNIEVQ